MRPLISLPRQLTITIFALAALSASLIGSFGLVAMNKVDRESEDRDKTLIEQAILEQRETLKKDQQSITGWDDSVIASRKRDIPWLDENLGVWMYTFFGHDHAYVLDPAGDPIYAMQGGTRVDNTAYRQLEASILPTSRLVRAKLPDVDSPDKAGMTDLVMLGDRVAMIAVNAIYPTTERTTQDPGAEFLHVAVQYVDKAMLTKIGRKYLIKNVDFDVDPSATPGHSKIALHANDGTIRGYLTWERRDPGTQMVLDTAPGLAGAGLAVFLVLLALYRRLRRAATRLQASETQATYLAFHDTLTGLPNRASFNGTLDKSLARLRETGTEFGLLCLDLDRFKQVNDTLGHPAGDELIRQVGERLLAEVGPDDFVGRLSGDEFAIIIQTSRLLAGIDSVAHRVVTAIGRPFTILGSQVDVGVSVGVLKVVDRNLDRAEVLRRADIALYEAKCQGRGRSFHFDEAIDGVVQAKRLMAHDLTRSLDTESDFRVVYQPLYASDGKTLVGAEALIRWDHPVRGMVGPDVFIPVAEERGSIVPLGHWILRKVCQTLRRIDLPWIAVNVSPVQMRTPGFAAQVAAALKEYGLNASRLQIEITEGILLDPSPAVAETLAKLRASGVRIAIDDFGTGYSSIQYLSQYTVDKIKIDRSFVQQVGGSRTSTAIIQAMLDLAKALDIDVTAEGIETMEQQNGMVTMGCGELQGFLLSRPIEVAALETLFRRPASGGAQSVLPKPNGPSDQPVLDAA